MSRPNSANRNLFFQLNSAIKNQSQVQLIATQTQQLASQTQQPNTDIINEPQTCS